MTSSPVLPVQGETVRANSENRRIRILGSRVDLVTFSQILIRIQEFLAGAAPNQIVTANTLMLLEAETDSELQSLIENAALVVPESWGISWAGRVKKYPLTEFIPGIDLFLALCRLSAQKGHRIFLLGAKPGIAEKAARALKDQFPSLDIVGYHHGYFSLQEEGVVLDAIRRAHPDMLFVGMSVPSQEKWIQRHLADLHVPVVMGVGGSFDVLSGNLKRAPGWMRRLGIEWVFRTLQEPWRMARIMGLPVFMWHVIRGERRT